jgi:4-amino-4-deoxy-L-arabinose transferase-like glycosyltransferase
MEGGRWHSPGVRRHLGILVLTTAPLLFLGLGNRDFWLPDEPFVAEVGREMAATGDWVTPRLNGEPFLEKPPLYYAAVALCFKTIGVTPLAARLPSAVANLITLLATYFLGRRLFSRRSAVWGALLLSTVYLFVHAGHYCLVDSGLVLFVTLGFWAAAYAFGDDRRPWALPLAYLAAALAFLEKGPVGPGLIGIGVVAFAALERDREFFRRRGHLLGSAVFAAVVVPWLAALWAAGGVPYFREAFLVNTVGRALSLPGMIPNHDTATMHTGPVYAYLFDTPDNFLPWTPLLVLAFLAAARRALRRVPPDRRPPRARTSWGGRFLGAGFWAGMLVLSAVKPKRSIYTLPLYPLLALLIAREVERLTEPRATAPDRMERALMAAQSIVVTVVGFAVTVAYYGFSGGFFGVRPGTEAIAISVSLAFLSLAGAISSGRAFLRGRFASFFRRTWAQAATVWIAFSLLVAPALGAERSYAPFFRRATVIERLRGRTPYLLTEHESYVGYADLLFGETLPRLDPSRTPPGEDVLTDRSGLLRLESNARESCEVLAEQPTGGLGRPSDLYLVSVAPADPPRGP